MDDSGMSDFDSEKRSPTRQKQKQEDDLSIVNYQKTVVVLTSRLANMTSRLERLLVEKEKSGERIRVLEEEDNQIRAQLHDTTMLVSRLEDRLAELESASLLLQQENYQFRLREAEFASSETKIQGLETKLSEAAEIVARKESELATLRNSLEKTKELLIRDEMKRAELYTMLDNAQESIVAATKANKSLIEKQHAIGETNQQLGTLVADLKGELRQKNTEISRLTSKIDEMTKTFVQETDVLRHRLKEAEGLVVHELSAERPSTPPRHVDTCPVCHETEREGKEVNIGLVPCGHVFCRPCLSLLYQGNRNTHIDCPVCKSHCRGLLKLFLNKQSE